MIEVGQKVKFDPMSEATGLGEYGTRSKVTGTVVFVNEPHGWFMVEFYMDQNKMRASFKNTDIGRVVWKSGK